MLVRTINFYYRQDVYAETNSQLTFYYARVNINTESVPPFYFSSPLFSGRSGLHFYIHPSGGAPDPPP